MASQICGVCRESSVLSYGIDFFFFTAAKKKKKKKIIILNMLQHI